MSFTTILNRNAEDAICTPVVIDILERYLIYIYVLRATFWQQTLCGIEVNFARLVYGTLPKVSEVCWHHRRGLKLFWREGSATSSLVVLAINMGRHIDAIESRLCHLSLQRQCTILQQDIGFLDILIHLRTSSIIDDYIIHQRGRTSDGNLESSRLSYLVGPVLMVRHNVHYDVIATYLRTRRQHNRQCQQQEKQFLHFSKNGFRFLRRCKDTQNILYSMTLS